MPSKSYARRIVWLAVVIVVVLVGYGIGWTYLADRLLGETQSTLAKLNRNGVEADCASADVRGFPFRMGLFCERVHYADSRQGISVEAGAFRSAAQIYDPARLVGEIDGPADLTLPDLGTYRLDWENLQASTRLATGLPSRSSLAGRTVTVTRDGAPLASYAEGSAHMRTRDADLDIAGNVEALTLDPGLTDGRKVPPFGADLDVSVTDGVALVERGTRSLRGVAGTLTLAQIRTPDGGSISLTGPYSIGQDGLIDARLTVAVARARSFESFLSELLPEYREQIGQALSAMSILGDGASLPLTIEKGRAAIAFIRLGDLPPLD